MQKIDGIEFRGTTSERWKFSVRYRLLDDPRVSRASRAWAASMVTAPEPAESILDYMVRSKMNEKELRLPVPTVGIGRLRLAAMRRRKTQAIRRGLPDVIISGEPQPIDFGDPDAW